MRLSDFLVEYLTDEQRQRYSTFAVDPKMRDLTDHFFGVGNDLITEPIEMSEPTQKSPLHLNIEHAVGQEISVEDYRRGIIKDRYNRDVKIGRLLKDEKLRNQFASDPDRQGTRKSGYYATIHRGVEVAGQTNSAPNKLHPTGHSWEGQSCKNVDTGSNLRYLHQEIQAGTVVIFVHAPNGKEIFRATLQPYMPRDSKSNEVIYRINSHYGVSNSAFMEFANNVAERLTKTVHDSTEPEFSIHPKVYNDSKAATVTHPRFQHMGDHEIYQIISHDFKRLRSETISKLIRRLSNTELLEKLYTTKLNRLGVFMSAIKPDILMTRANAIADAFAANPWTPASVLVDMMRRPISFAKPVRVRAMLNRSFPEELLPKYINVAKDDSIALSVILRSPRAPEVQKQIFNSILKLLGKKDRYDAMYTINYLLNTHIGELSEEQRNILKNFVVRKQ